jgi:hypothetical protein
MFAGMTRAISPQLFPWRLFTCCLLLGLGACGRMSFEEREPWRREAETSCLQAGAVKEGPAVAMLKAIDGPGACGIDHPLRVAALGEPALMSFAEEATSAHQAAPIDAQWRASIRAVIEPVPLARSGRAAATARPAAVTPAATLVCPMVSALDRFVSETVQPAAMRWFNQSVVTIKQISAYSCRGMNDNPFSHISEHAFGNALDIAAFTLADGHTISVKTGWRGTPAEQGFLHDVEEGACAMFTTVLAPGSNAYHEDHMHVDLMRRSSGRAVCQPHALPGEAAAFLSGGHHGEARQAATTSVTAARLGNRGLLQAIARDR